MLFASTDLMSVVEWSRAQFAMTAIYHWLFVPLTLGLGFICAIMETIYYRTGDEFWKRTTKFWMRIFGINFAVGVATGLILEFEFGTNWSNYSHFVGDIFGAPLAIEGIFAFFLEATFLAVMFFGWNRVSKGFHLSATWLTAIGANISALWILVANSWMQHPVGMAFNPATARMEMVSFWEVLSPTALNKFAHTVTSGFILSALVVIGISAWYLLKNREKEMATRSIKVASIFGCVAIVLLALTSHSAAKIVARTQPMKLAAMEAVYDGQNKAGLSAFGLLKPEAKRAGGKDAFYFNVEFPGMLSWLGYGNTNAYVAGINDIVNGNPAQGIMSTAEKIERGRVAIGELGKYQAAVKSGNKELLAMQAAIFDANTPEGKMFTENYLKYFGYGYLSSPKDIVPNVAFVYYSFRIMIGLGFFFLLLLSVVLYKSQRGTIDSQRWLLYVMLWTIPLAYIATICGWIVTELGRQPWAIQDVLPTVAAVSRLNPTSVVVTFFVFLALFTALLIAELKIITRQIKNGPADKK